MLDIIQENGFKKDIKRCKKRGYDFDNLKAIVTKLANGDELEQRHRVHLLSNNWAGYWECHIKPNWLLIYKLTNSSVIISQNRYSRRSIRII